MDASKFHEANFTVRLRPVKKKRRLAGLTRLFDGITADALRKWTVVASTENAARTGIQYTDLATYLTCAMGRGK